MVSGGFVGGFGWLWVVLGGFGSFWVVPCFSNYLIVFRIFPNKNTTDNKTRDKGNLYYHALHSLMSPSCHILALSFSVVECK